jgi:hypothetical protein
MLSQRLNTFRICSAYFPWCVWNGLWFPLVLNMRENCLLVSWKCLKNWLLVGWECANWLLVGWACAQKLVTRKLSIRENFGALRAFSEFFLSSSCHPFLCPLLPSLHCNGRPIAGTYNSLKDTRMWKLGLRPRYYFSGNICFKFSAFFLCSAKYVPAQA